MKSKLLCAIIAACFATQTFAQDIIITKDAEKIEAKITGINRSTVNYQTMDGEEQKTLLKSQIASITFEDGTVEVYNVPSPTHVRPQTAQPITCDDLSEMTADGGNFFLGDRRLLKREVFYAMDNCCPEAHKCYQSGHHRMVGAAISTGVGVGLGIVGGMIALLTTPLDDDDDASDLNDVGVVTFVAGGVVACGIGIPLWVSGTKKKKKAYRLLGEKCIGPQNSSAETPIRLDLTGGNKKVGVALKF